MFNNIVCIHIYIYIYTYSHAYSSTIASLLSVSIMQVTTFVEAERCRGTICMRKGRGDVVNTGNYYYYYYYYYYYVSPFNYENCMLKVHTCRRSCVTGPEKRDRKRGSNHEIT